VRARRATAGMIPLIAWGLPFPERIRGIIGLRVRVLGSTAGYGTQVRV